MVPAAKLYTRVVEYAISHCQRLGMPFKLGDLRQEILHWRFLDSWTGCVPWRTKEHKVVQLCASDALQSRWDTTLSVPGGGGHFSDDLGNKDIAVKEVFALLSALQAFSPHLNNTQVDVLVDNKVLYHAWL